MMTQYKPNFSVQQIGNDNAVSDTVSTKFWHSQAYTMIKDYYYERVMIWNNLQIVNRR